MTMDFEQGAELLKAIADPTRLKIIAMLQQRDCCVCELVPVCQVSQPAVSKHMRRLKSAGIVKETRRGQWVIYALNREQLTKISSFITSLPDMSKELKELEDRGLLVCVD